MKDRPPPRDEKVPAAAHVLDDGRLVELVYSPKEKRTAFAIGRDNGFEVLESLTLRDGTTLVPISPRNNLIRLDVVVLPEKPEECGSPAELAAEIEAYIDRFLDLSPAFKKTAVVYVLLSWVYDRFNELPYLRFRGDFGTGKTRALTVIGSLLYKGFLASGASTVSPIFYILDTFRGSLVLDEADFRFSDEKAELSKILNNGNVNGFPVLRQTTNAKKEFDPRAFRVFGPKIVGVRQSFEDPALESRFLTEDMGVRPLRKGIPINLPDRQKDEARTLRNKLLSYRFRHWGEAGIREEGEHEGQSARTRQIVAPLLAVAPTAEHCEAIRALASSLDRDVRSDQAQSLEATLLEVVVALAAESDQSMPVTLVSRRFAEKIGADSDRPITPRYTGYLLRKRLRLRTQRSHGVYAIPASERDKIAFLAARFGVDPERGAA